ncbi:syntaxin-18 isoform X1 [Equus quagga]|uniref:syntaxin-18 isoform X1 n=1 Tax=Equus quagga TaxID=89248 RepID=UPI001EE1A619|nr:syntaxin-18 isoform X1 [Equus quagga]
MAVDITLLFRASVKTVKTRNKALGVAVGGGVDGSRDELFRRSPRPKGDFSSRAREVVACCLSRLRMHGCARGECCRRTLELRSTWHSTAQVLSWKNPSLEAQSEEFKSTGSGVSFGVWTFTFLLASCVTLISHIGKLRDFLLEHRKDYINAYSHIMSEYGKMTDTERDQIDQDAQTFMRTCSEAIQQLRAQAHKEIHSQQVKEHRSAVLDFIEDYLKRVCKLYSEQRAIRVKRVVDKKRLSKLEPEPNTKTKESMFSEKVSQNPKDSEEKPITEEYPEKIPAEAQPELRSWGDGRGEDELSPEEIQMFEQENQRLIGEMNSLFDEVRQIEGKVVEISRLQEIFTEKVLQQEAEIDSIHQLVVGATENIKEGNEDIREAIKNNAGFRVWVLFFLVMCSFSLLFLDWYDS